MSLILSCIEVTVKQASESENKLVRGKLINSLYSYIYICAFALARVSYWLMQKVKVKYKNKADEYSRKRYFASGIIT